MNNYSYKMIVKQLLVMITIYRNIYLFIDQFWLKAKVKF